MFQRAGLIVDCMLQGALFLDAFIHFDLVTNLHIVIVFHRNTALGAALDFLNVILETTQAAVLALVGDPEAVVVALVADVDVVSGLGLELSVDHAGMKIHMLAYFLEPTNGPLQDRLAELRSGRNIRNQKIVRRLNEIGYSITMEDVLRHADGDAVGRPHIADALVEAGLLEVRSEAFVDLLGDGGSAYFERKRLTAIEAITLTTESGGVTSTIVSGRSSASTRTIE